MIKVIYAISLLGAGFAMGWWFQSPLARTESDVLIDTTKVDKNPTIVQSVVTDADQACNPISLTADSSIGNQNLADNASVDDAASKHQKLRAYNIKLLEDFEFWPSYQSWLDAFDLLTPHTSELYLVKAKAAIILDDNYLDALQAYFLAIEHATSFKRQKEYVELAESFITNTIDRVDAEEVDIDPVDFRFFLESVYEKKPGFPPVHLALALRLAEQGNKADALLYLSQATKGTVFDARLAALRGKIEALGEGETKLDLGIPLIKHGNQYIVRVMASKSHELKLLIDTGASATVFSEDTVDHLLSVAPRGFINARQFSVLSTANGGRVSRIFELDSLAIDKYLMSDLKVYEADLGSSEHFDGLLGMDYLSQFNFYIDREENRLILKRDE